MKTLIITGCLSILTVISSLASGLTAREIFDEHQNRHTLIAEKETILMKIVYSPEQSENRILIRKTLRKGEDYKSLMYFKKPVTISGVAMLTLKENNHEEQWLYLPANRMLKRIAGSGKKGSFAGTDFSYEDFIYLNADDFKFIKHENIDVNDNDCFVIDVLPATEKAKSQTNYKKRRFYIDSLTYFIWKIEFYDKRGRSLKVQNNYSPINVTNKVLRPEKIIMTNNLKNRKTFLQLTNIIYDPDYISALDFSKQNIQNGKYYQ